MNLLISSKWLAFTHTQGKVIKLVLTPKIAKAMKLTFILLTAACLQVAAEGKSQNVTIAVKDASIEKIFREIGRQTGFGFLYTKKMLEDAPKVDLDVKNTAVTEVLKHCLKGQSLDFSIQDNTIIITRKVSVGSILSPAPAVITVTGRVTDEKGLPVPSVSVVIPGTTLGAMTDANGDYAIANAPENANLLFSYIGYESQRIAIKGRTLINVVLRYEVKELDATVVIGYGTTTKRKSTGSISSITAEEIAKQPVANPLNAMQGRVAGALVTQSNGLPGSRVTIQIRGQNTISATDAGSQPLYIVDGIPFMISDNSTPNNNDLNGRGDFAASGGQSPFHLINPGDIERIDILKDADATAIYGARGGNGVVLITTKKGAAGKTKVDINVYQGHGKVGHFIPMMNTQQYLQMRKEAFINAGATPTAGNAPDLLLWDQNANTDWQRKYMGGTANMTDAQTTVSGGDARTRFLMNVGFHHETPVFPGDYKSQRVSTRLSANHNSQDRKFNANVSFGYSFDHTDLLSRDLSTLYNLPPNLPLFNPNGTLYWFNASIINPESSFPVKYFGKTHNLMTSALLRYTLLPGLDLKTSFGFNKVSLDQNTQTPIESINPFNTSATTGIPAGNQASFADIEQNSYILEPQATYTRDIFKGQLLALAGGTFQNSLNTSTRLKGNNYANKELLGNISSAGTTTIPTFGYTQYRYTSLFGRLTYDWESKYLLNAVARRDGSSRFGTGKRFGNFWSIGAGWVFSNEKFAKLLPFLSFGKLRGSYGLTGNDQIQEYQYRTFFVSSGTYQGVSTLRPNNVENPDLHWQTIKKLEFGLDLAFLNKRLEVTANYYRNRTADQLGFLSLPPQTGFNSVTSNFEANIQNTGFELEVNTVNVKTEDFSWRTSFNVTIPRTKLLSASPSYFFFNEDAIGQPLSTVLRFSYQGVDPSTGRPLYKDVARDTLTFTPNFNTDRQRVGFSAPKLYGGLNNVLTYKQFDLSFFFQFTRQSGNILPSATPGALGTNLPTFWLDRWTKGGAANFPQASTNTSVYSSWSGSDAIWGDATFLRLRTVNLSYAFPRELTNRWKVDNLRLYLSAQNLWWTSKNKYVYDPETGTSTPPLQVITAGINVTL